MTPRRMIKIAARFVSVSMLAFVAAACSFERPLPVPLPAPPWHSALERGHPLAGRIWLPREDRFIDTEDLFYDRMARARFLLLGERHDNADHHRIQAWITASLIKRGSKPALVMEMFTADQQAAIDSHLSGRPGDSAGLGTAVGWSRSGWGAWSSYEPIVRPVAQNRLMLVAANITRARIKEIYGKGYAALGPERMKALGLDRPIGDPLLAALDKEIADSHCGVIDPGKARPFTRIQVVRDANFAAAMIRGAAVNEAMALGAPGAGGAILIAGAGHVRSDRGVPFHLKRQGVPAGEVFSVGLIEVSAGATDPGAYAAAYGTRRLPFDAVWFTPRRTRDDPCKKFKSSRKKN